VDTRISNRRLSVVVHVVVDRLDTIRAERNFLSAPCEDLSSISSTHIDVSRVMRASINLKNFQKDLNFEKDTAGDDGVDDSEEYPNQTSGLLMRKITAGDDGVD
jgi:hypothetical protein